MSHAVFCSVLMGIDKVFLLVVVDVISIHAPLAGCDALLRPPGNRRAKRRFQSTHPLRGATYRRAYGGWRCGISIHAPLAGCDRRVQGLYRGHGHFNPRTPCGVRPAYRSTPKPSSQNFNPRTPCGVRLRTIIPRAVSRLISIHAPLAGCDWLTLDKDPAHQDFNPRTPCGVRRVMDISSFLPSGFQSTHPLRGATWIRM